MLTGRALSRGCTTTNRRPDGSSSGAHGLSRIGLSPIEPVDTSKCWTIIGKGKYGEEKVRHVGTL